MSLSSQSQEAIASVNAELEEILKKGSKTQRTKGIVHTSSSSGSPEESQDAVSQKKAEEDSESESDIHTESEGEDENVFKKWKHTKEEIKPSPSITGKKRVMDANPQEEEVKPKSPKSLKTSTQAIPVETTTKRPVMVRTKSLEAIGKHPPTEIIQVCLEKK